MSQVTVRWRPEYSPLWIGKPSAPLCKPCEEARRAEGFQARSISRIPKTTFVFVC
jgi:hypothetical protein